MNLSIIRTLKDVWDSLQPLSKTSKLIACDPINGAAMTPNSVYQIGRISQQDNSPLLTKSQNNSFVIEANALVVSGGIGVMLQMSMDGIKWHTCLQFTPYAGTVVSPSQPNYIITSGLYHTSGAANIPYWRVATGNGFVSCESIKCYYYN